MFQIESLEYRKCMSTKLAHITRSQFLALISQGDRAVKCIVISLWPEWQRNCDL